MASIKSTSRSSLIPEMDQHIKRMMKLIDEDADSFTKKVEIYYQKRPELMNLVDEVHRMYRSLAERYDHVAGELRKNIPADLQSNCSGITDLGSEPPSTFPSPGPSRRQSGHRAPGFDFFLGNNGVVSPELFNKGDESPPPVESESESDDSSINYDGAHSNEDESEPKILTLWEEHRITKEKLRESEQEIARLRQELSCRGSSPNFHDNNLKIAQKELFMSKNKIKEEKGEIARLHDRVARYRSIVADRDLDVNLLKAEIADKNAYIDNLKISLNELQRKHDELLDEKDDLNIHIFELGEELSYKDDRIDQISMHLHQLQVEHIETVAGAEAARRATSELSSKIRELEIEVKDKQAVIDQGAEEKQEAMRQLSFSLEHYRNGYHRLRAVVSGQNTAVAS